MKNFYFVLVLALSAAAARAQNGAQNKNDALLAAPVGGAEAAAQKMQKNLNCLDGEQVTQRATQELAKFRARGESFPNLLTLNTAADVGVEHGKTTRKLFAEAFARPDPFFYSVIPGIELGVEFDHESLIYVCLDTIKPEAKRSFSIYFMSSGALDPDFWSKFRSKEVVMSRRNVRSHTTSNFVQLFYQVPLFEPFFELLNNVVVLPGENFVESLVGTIDQWGVERIVVGPRDIVINSGHNTGLGVIPWGFERRFAYTSKWMLDDADAASTQP